MKNRISTLALVSLALATSVPAWADTPADLTDLVGARGSSGETQMLARGYALIRVTQVRDQAWSFWWSDTQNQCVAVATSDGRYASINGVPTQNCRPGGASGTAKPEPTAGTLTLICYGQGEHATISSHSGYEWNRDKKHYEPTTRFESDKERFNTGVQIDIKDGAGRIHLTGKLIPPLNSGGSDGWWPLENLRMEPDRITARYKLNFASSPTVSIDRNTGFVEIQGLNSFSGKCDMGDWAAGRRF
ncbi:hypothetical protein [Roseateles sp. LYH14W]|uniref:Uncharacterized protein n=1 Tax=Pelomonas parva TaxID=3299032 RepID=A0ABW7F0K6_9BURK